MISSEPRRPTGWLILLGCGWYVAAWTLVFVALDADRVVDSRGGFLGGDIVASGVGQRAAVVPMLLGLVIVVLAGSVLLGMGWALVPLVLAGTMEVLGLALVGSWLTVPAMVAVVMGSIPAVLPVVHDYLWSDTATRSRLRHGG